MECFLGAPGEEHQGFVGKLQGFGVCQVSLVHWELAGLESQALALPHRLVR